MGRRDKAGMANDPTGPDFTGGPPMSTGEVFDLQDTRSDYHDYTSADARQRVERLEFRTPEFDMIEGTSRPMMVLLILFGLSIVFIFGFFIGRLGA